MKASLAFDRFECQHHTTSAARRSHFAAAFFLFSAIALSASRAAGALIFSVVGNEYIAESDTSGTLIQTDFINGSLGLPRDIAAAGSNLFVLTITQSAPYYNTVDIYTTAGTRRRTDFCLPLVLDCFLRWECLCGGEHRHRVPNRGD